MVPPPRAMRQKWQAPKAGSRGRRRPSPEAAEEDQNHEGCHKQAEGSFMDERLNGILDEDGLIEDDIGRQAVRNIDQSVDGGLDAVDDGDRVRVAALL